MKTVPITTNFDKHTDSGLGTATFTEDGIKAIREMIEMGSIPSFAVGFIGEPDENGVYHNAELIEISMVFPHRAAQ